MLRGRWYARVLRNLPTAVVRCPEVDERKPPAPSLNLLYPSSTHCYSFVNVNA